MALCSSPSPSTGSAAPSLPRTLRVSVGALVVVLASSCATPIPPGPALGAFRRDVPAAAVRLGPIVDLSSGRTSRDKVKAVADGDGQVRVLIASTELQQVVELVVRPEGVVQRRVVAPHASPWSIDAAFDSSGRFHALVDTEHLVLQEQGWRASERTPWHDAGVTPRRWAHFVPGAPRLTFAFHADGGDVGAPTRMEFWGIGGAAGAMMWPWFTHGQRAVIVAETTTGFGPWVVLEPQTKGDTHIRALAADASGAVHVRFTSSTGGLGGQSEGRYARIGADSLGDIEAADPGPSAAPGTAGGRGRLRGVRGGIDDDDFPSALAADPQSGIAMVGLCFLMRGGDLVAGPLELPLDIRMRNPDVRTAAAGRGAFHALVSALVPGQKDTTYAWYLLFSDGRWSAPIQLGPTGVASFWGTGWDAYSITGLPGGAAFVVWPTQGGIVGRWVVPAG